MRVIELSNPEVYKLLDKLCNQEVPFNTANVLTELRAIVAQNVDFYESSRINLLKQHGKKDKDGKLVLVDGVVQFDEQEQIAFTTEMENIANQNFTRLQVKATDIAPLKLTANDIQLLTALIEIIS